MSRIAFVTPPFAGHFNPLFALALAARDAGYEIEFITGPRKSAVIRRHRLTPLALRSIGDDTLESIANTAEPVTNNPLRLLAQFRQNLRLLPAIGEELEQLWRTNPPALVVADSVAPIAGLVAERLRLPWITTIATPFALEARRGTPTYCGGWMPASNALEQARDAAGRAAIHIFKRTVGFLFRKEFRQLGLSSLYRSKDNGGSEAIYSPHAILGFGLRELEFERDWPPCFEMIGPVIAAPEPASPLLLPDAHPRVLVTVGTHLLWAKRELVEQVVALSRAWPEVHFIVSLGEAESSVTPFTQAADRVRVYPFVAYQENLERFDAIIHHGGAGVTYAALLAGVPSLVVPHDYDQFDYAARLAYHGLGLRVRSLSQAAEALPRLLDRVQWPALTRFQVYARAYEPEKAFLATVKQFAVPA
ncbi:MAG: glycosyltransferase family 1 protein [Acidobacteria bacterium]|nr:glycosyltransferase family 1 protein [Acidobacteriota bacterium]